MIRRRFRLAGERITQTGQGALAKQFHRRAAEPTTTVASQRVICYDKEVGFGGHGLSDQLDVSDAHASLGFRPNVLRSCSFGKLFERAMSFFDQGSLELLRRAHPRAPPGARNLGDNVDDVKSRPVIFCQGHDLRGKALLVNEAVVRNEDAFH